MAINTDQRKEAQYFVGTEVENTAMRGEKTLFVVGIQPIDDIVKILSNIKSRHVYLGASQSFNPVNVYEWENWNDLITGLLTQDLWVTLDFDVAYANDIHDQHWCEYLQFIPMISVKLPNIRLYNYNATVKIDDRTWGATNPGVWCHPLNELMTRNVYTDWKDYVGDVNLRDVDSDESI